MIFEEKDEIYTRCHLLICMENSILTHIGSTPLVSLRRIPVEEDCRSDISLKLEFFNPTGSLKDRIYLEMFRDAMADGKLRRGMSVVEASTGNAGISCTFVGRALGFQVTVVMPENMSEERGRLIEAFGGKIIKTTGGESDVDIAIEKVRSIMADGGNEFWFPNQFENASNPKAHYRTTGPEILKQSGGRVDAFVAASGSGGTVSGVGRYLKEAKPGIRVYTVEPEEAPVLSSLNSGTHRIEGIGDGFVPPNLDLSLLDGVITVSSEEAMEMTRRLHRDEGIFCGISSGCNVAAALKLAFRHPELKHIVTMANDSGNRYFSTELFGYEKKHPVSRDRKIDMRSIREVERHRHHIEKI